MIKKDLIKYIREFNSKGYSYEQLHKSLLEQGYNEEDIKDALKNLKPNTELFLGFDINDPKVKLISAILFLFAILTVLLIVSFSDSNYEYNDNNYDDLEPTIECSECQYKEADQCFDYVCCQDIDCDDKDDKTVDICDNKKTKLSKCINVDVTSPKTENTTTNTGVDNGPRYCRTDDDCDDNNLETSDVCRFDKTCSNKIIRECRDNDNFCPLNCNYENDNDCSGLPVGNCYVDDDCDDLNPATKDLCLKSDGSDRGVCDNELITKCIASDNICPEGCNYNTDSDCLEDNQCSTDSDCDDDDENTLDSCQGIVFRVCVFEYIKKCSYGDNYCPFGCTEKTDNDCSGKIEVTYDYVREICDDDIFCYTEKIILTKDWTNCENIIRYWNDDKDYFIPSCMYEIAKISQDSSICNQIESSDFKENCISFFS